MSNDGKALNGLYKVTCPYCATRICGSSPKGVFDLVSDAARALNAHLQYACPSAPRLRSHRRRELAASQVQSVDE